MKIVQRHQQLLSYKIFHLAPITLRTLICITINITVTLNALGFRQMHNLLPSLQWRVHSHNLVLLAKIGLAQQPEDYIDSYLISQKGHSFSSKHSGKKTHSQKRNCIVPQGCKIFYKLLDSIRNGLFWSWFFFGRKPHNT